MIQNVDNYWNVTNICDTIKYCKRVLYKDVDFQTSYYMYDKWAPARDFQQCGILTCAGSDDPAQPPFKLRHSK